MRLRSSVKKQWKTFKNEDIKAFNIIVIDTEGVNLGSMPRAKALAMSQELELDLVQIAYDSANKVATAKIMDYGKYMYEKKKKENDSKKQKKAKGQKEIKFGYNIGENDLSIKLKKAGEFLQKGYSVKLMVVLRGREKAYKELVRDRFVHIEEVLSERGKSQGIKMEQFGFALLMVPKKK